MTTFLVFWLPWLLSLITIYTMFLAGSQNKSTWLLALFGQFIWLLWILLSHSWGLLPMNIALWVIYARNHFKWNV